MQNLHFKLTSKYPQYNNWHQTKHHNTIHWGVLVFFTLLIFGTISRWTPISFAADTVPPTIPTNLIATAISSSQINLSWTASTDDIGVTGYKIYRCIGSVCTPITQIATSATNSYSNTGLTASTAYTYAVSAYDAAENESGKSTQASATTLSQTGNTYYISPTGSDTSGDGSYNTPWKTITKAFEKGGSNIYIFKNGYYDYIGAKIKNIPSGSEYAYTIIKAEHDGAVKINAASFGYGNYCLHAENSSYFQVEGFDCEGTAYFSKYTHHANLKRVGIKNGGVTIAGTYPYPEDEKPHDILVEDVWIYGTGPRYKLHAHGAYNITWRRSVVRWDSSPNCHVGWPNAGIVPYDSSDFIIENSIALDFNNDPYNPWAAFLNVKSTKNIKMYGNIALNTGNFRAFDTAEYASGGGNDLINSVAWDAAPGGIKYMNPALSKVDHITLGNITQYPVYISNSQTKVDNSILYNLKDGVGCVGNYNVYYQSGSDHSGCSNTTEADPKLKYFLRVEPDSPAYGTGKNGTNRGATIIKRYVDGVLTDEPLWPWPYEDRIKELFSEDNPLEDPGCGPPSNNPIRGWTATNKTLTQYIWEYLGNQIPCEIYNECGGAPDTMPPIVPINLTATPISSSQINLSWTASTDDVGVTGYKIYRNSQFVNSLNSLMYNDIDLTASTAYTYTVSAFDAAGNESAQSQSISATTLPSFKPSDLNQDEVVNQLDFDILKQDFSRTDKPKSDLNQDGIVDSRDLGIMMSEWSR